MRTWLVTNSGPGCEQLMVLTYEVVAVLASRNKGSYPDFLCVPFAESPSLRGPVMVEPFQVLAGSALKSLHHDTPQFTSLMYHLCNMI